MTASAPAYVVREARPDEWAAVGEVVARSYAHRDGRDDSPYLAHIRDVADRARTCTILAAVGPEGRVVGGVTYVPGPESPYAETEREGEAGIRMLGVDPEAQGRGIGRALTVACIERARADGRSRITLVTAEHFAAARHIYATLGFRRAPERDFSPVPGIRLEGFELDL